MQHEYIGTLVMEADGRLWVTPGVGCSVELASLLHGWIGHQVRVIVADGRERRWVLIETEREDGDGVINY